MKKLLYLIILVVPMLVIGQTTTENYIKTTSYKSEYKKYGDGTTTIIAEELLDNNANFSTINQIGGHVTITNGAMSIEILGGWATGYTLKTGVIKDLHESFDIPDTDLGAIVTASGNPTGFYANIENNKLIFSSPYVIQSINDMTLSANLPPEYDDAFSVTFNNTIYNCDDNYGTYSSLGSVTVNNSVLSFSLLAQSNSSCFLKLGPIYQLQVDVPDTELGNIPYENGEVSPYKVKIENNWVVFYTDQIIPAYTNNLDFSFALNLPHTSISDDDKVESITYFDGLGRTIQQISSRAGGQGQDIITPFAYDDYGRQTEQYLPYVNLGQSANSTSLNYRGNTVTLNVQPQYYLNKYADDFSDPNAVNAYSVSKLEASPLNRVLKQGAPGTTWQVNANNSDDDHTIKYEYHVNTYSDTDLTKDNVKYFLVGNSNGYVDIQLNDNGYYAEGELSKKIIKDENWQPNQPAPKEKNHTTEEFTDRLGNTILKRNYNDGLRHDTYYIYDDFGNLSYVLPPLVNTLDGVSLDELSKLCYQYKYDHRNRLIEKKIPGKGWEYIVHDKLDRPTLTQDANLRLNNKWLFTKYDVLGRITYTGMYTGVGSTRNSIQNAVDNSTITFEKRETNSQVVNGTAIFYSNNVFPDNDIDVLTVNYYDDYDIGNQITLNPENGSWPWEGMEISLETKGLPTVSRIRVLETDDWITTATYYDEKGRPWQSHIKNDFLNIQDWEFNKLDFTGNIEKTVSSHINSSYHITTADNYTYDHLNRLLTHKQKIGNHPEEIIVSNTYDELGQLISKGVGGKTTQNRLQDVNYKYNVRGWLKEINDVANLGSDLFSFKINYNTLEGNVSYDKLYNGNISQTIWKTASINIMTNTSGEKRGYTYKYDPLNRIKRGTMRKGDPLNTYTRHHLRSIDYDKNGNITNLERDSGTGIMDKLAYDYDGNKLLKVTDTAPNDSTTEGFIDGNTNGNDYSYDENGNMILDKNKGISSITYNHLNLPTSIGFSNQQAAISYVYDATGVKLKKVVAGSGIPVVTTDYAGNYIYENNVLQFFNHAEGYVQPVFTNGSTTISSFEYVYQYKDHLGNIRLSYSDSNNDGIIIPISEIIEESNYYPFGLEHKGYNNVVNGTENNYQTFQGQELEEELGKNTLAFQWRDYDPAIARFNKIDRFSEKYHPVSPYAFTANNPLKFMEIKGDSLKVANNDQTKEYLNSAAKNRNQDFIKYDDDGNVSLDFGDLSEKKIARRLKNDSGLSVINDMVNATDSEGNSENFYFEVSNNREGVLDGQEFSLTLSAESGDVVTDYSWFDNFSTTPRGDGYRDVTPANGMDGAVYMSPGKVYNTNVSYDPLNIGGYVRHELRENYSRTHDKKPYKEAHESAGYPSVFTRFKFD